MEDDLKIWKFECLGNHWSNLPQILTLSSGDQTKVKIGFNEDDLQWKTTSNGRWPQNMKIWISQQPLIGYSSNFKHKLIRSYQIQKRFQWRRPSFEDLMEDDLKVQKFEYLSSHWSDLPQILNISSWDQTIIKKGFNEDELQWKTTSKGRWPQNMRIWISQRPLKVLLF